ncbi:oxidoreductase, partial [Candidatus Woesearchaeota archaeon CG08_land_8_20_14_0_20_43_7]
MLKFGIVGCGRISQKHVKALLDAKDAKLSAICDIKPETMSSLSEKIPFEVKKYLSYDDFLDSDIDVVSICTPSGLHAEMTIAAAKKKKHVLCEKPMAMTLEDADAMIKAHQNAGTFLIIVKQNRENPAIKLLKEAVDAGRFGKLLMANATVRWTRPQEYYDQDPWRGTPEMDGSVLFNQASHHIDLLQWFLGPVRSVKAYAEILDHDIKVADSAVAVLKFESGAIGCVEATT